MFKKNLLVILLGISVFLTFITGNLLSVLIQLGVIGLIAKPKKVERVQTAKSLERWQSR